MVTLKLKKHRHGPAAGFHPWIFSGALAGPSNNLAVGDPVRIANEKGEFLACGYFNAESTIAVKIWGFDPDEEVNQAFFEKRVRHAVGLRQGYIDDGDTTAYRLIHGESDLLPGLIVDKYADYLCIQFHNRGIERWRREILSALIDVASPRGIYERSDSHAGKRDGVPEKRGLLHGTVPELVQIRENGLMFLVDIMEGQKTGFFLDQRDKRKAVMKYAGGADVLNCFSYSGGFSVYALKAGAASIVNVDASEKALDIAKENVRINGFDDVRCAYIRADVKKYLQQASDDKRRFDLVILDPPAFIKEKTGKRQGLAGYRYINERGMKLVAEKGILVTCSCSAFLSGQEFRFLLSASGAKARRPFTIVEEYSHGIDHPALLPFTEGDYLKCIIMNAMT